MYRVAILHGGPSNEHEVSNQTGKEVHLAFSELKDKYKAYDLFISKDGKWYLRGLPIRPADLHEHVDVVWNAMHGEYGEDGKVQKILDEVGMPYTGSQSVASAIGLHKEASKKAFKNIGLQTPRYLRFDFDHDGDQDPVEISRIIHRHFSPPWIVKWISSGSSVGVFKVETLPELSKVIESCMIAKKDVLVEECIHGREVTVGVIEGFRGEDLYTLPDVEIKVKKGKKFFDYEAKYEGGSEEVCPGQFTHDEKKLFAEAARMIHRGLGLRHYSRTDMILHPKRGLFILEVNTLPGLTKGSLIPLALRSVGAKFHEFVDHITHQAMKR